MMKKIIALLLTFSMLLPFGITSLSASLAVYEIGVQYEFEDTAFIDDFEILRQEGAVGRRCITSDISFENTDAPKPELNLSFNAPKDGRYFLWVRYCAPASDKSALYAAQKSEALNQASFTLPVTGEGIWLWTNVRSVDALKGTNTLRIAHRHSGLMLDSFIISDDETFFPKELMELNAKKAEYDKLMSENQYKILPGKKGELKDGVLHFEVEDYVYLKKDNTIFNGSKLSGGKGVVLQKQTYTPNTDYPTEPIIKITFDAKKDTEYYFWLRYNAYNTSTDYLHYKFDNSENYLAAATPVIEKDVYSWMLLETERFDEGVHTLNIVCRKNGLRLDKIVIATDPMYYPSGFGEWDPLKKSDGSIIYSTDKKPITSRPRLWFTKEDIPKILENAKMEENKSAWDEFLKYAQSDEYKPDASLSSYSADMIKAIDSKAFYYAIYGDEKTGREAIDYLVEFISTKRSIATSEYTTKGETTYLLAIVYDWCYPLLTEKEKVYFQNQVIAINQTNEIGWPPSLASSLIGHGTENILMRDLVAAAIAMYGDNDEIYQNVMGRFFNEYVPSRKFMNQSGYYLPGQYYFNYRFQWEVLATILIDKAYGIESLFGEGTKGLIDYARYSRRPDGTYLMDGDKTWNNNSPGTYSIPNIRAYLYLAGYYKDKGIKYDYLKSLGEFGPTSSGIHTLITPSEFLILNDPHLGFEDAVSDMPLTKFFPSPYGAMIARTGWSDGINSADVVAEFKVGENYFTDHQHLDAGGFTLYYKGGLANDTGYYQAASYDQNTNFRTENDGNTHAGTMHDANYATRTIAHNCMLVYDPDEEFIHKYRSAVDVENDGGQMYTNESNAANNFSEYQKNPDKWKTGEVLGAELGEDKKSPEWSYLKGDISYAYSDKVEEYERSFMFMNFKNDDVPAALIVFDRIKSSDPSFKKTWLLHTKNKPETDGMKAVATVTDSGYNGKITLDTLLPEKENAVYNVVEGDAGDAWVNGTNYYALVVDGGINEGGGSRIELSPVKESKEDMFLNVMQVTDADSESYLPVSRIDSPTHVGVIISDRAVLFAKQRDRVEENISFEIDKPGKYLITVADCREGMWQIKMPDGTMIEKPASKDGGVVSFEGVHGRYTLTHTGTDREADAELITVQANEIPTLIKIGNGFAAFENKPYMTDGTTWVCVREVMEYMGYKGSYNPESGILKVQSSKHSCEFKKDSSVYMMDDAVDSLGYTAIEKDGELYLPIRFMKKVFSADFRYNEKAKIVSVTLSSQSEEAEEEIVCTPEIDGIYKLDHPANVSSLRLKIENALPKASYSVYVSSDGKNWRSAADDTQVIEGYSGKYMLVRPGENAAYVKITPQNCEIAEVRAYGSTISDVELHIVSCTESEANQGVEVGANTIDGNSATLWAAEGEDEWVMYEFDVITEISALEIMWNNGNKRVAYFDILVSDDGENWTYALKDGTSSGISLNLERYEFDEIASGKYLKINCHGNSTSKWNGVKEVKIHFEH